MTRLCLPADILAASARIAAAHIRQRIDAERVPATLAADLEKLRAAREVLERRRIALHGRAILTREIARMEEDFAERAA